MNTFFSASLLISTFKMNVKVKWLYFGNIEKSMNKFDIKLMCF